MIICLCVFFVARIDTSSLCNIKKIFLDNSEAMALIFYLKGNVKKINLINSVQNIFSVIHLHLTIRINLQIYIIHRKHFLEF